MNAVVEAMGASIVLNGIQVGAVIDCSGTAEVARAVGAEYLATDETTQAPAVIFPLNHVGRELKTAASVAQVLLPLARAGLPPLSFQPAAEPDTVTVKFTGRPEQVPQVIEVLRTEVNGFENCLTPLTEFTVARRAGGMIVGQYVLTGADVLAGRKFDDGAARGAWPIEQWDADGRTRLRYLADGAHYEIPARSLHAVATENLFMAGKSLSADVDGIASARVMGCCLATGAAAGQYRGGIAGISRKNMTRTFKKNWAETFRYAAEHSPFYRELFRGLSDVPPLEQVPLTDKEMISERNLDFLSVPRERVVEIVTTSGTTGQPLLWMLTEADLRRLARNERESFECAGLTSGDTVLLAVAMDRCFMAGLAYWLGLRELGCAVVRAGAGSPLFVLEMIARAQPTAIVAVPSFLRLIAEKARAAGFDLANCSVKKAVCIGEPVRDRALALNASGRAIETAWGARVYSTYGLTELANSLCECDAGAGGHLHEEQLHLEILDDNGQRRGRRRDWRGRGDNLRRGGDAADSLSHGRLRRAVSRSMRVRTRDAAAWGQSWAGKTRSSNTRARRCFPPCFAIRAGRGPRRGGVRDHRPGGERTFRRHRGARSWRGVGIHVAGSDAGAGEDCAGHSADFARGNRCAANAAAGEKTAAVRGFAVKPCILIPCFNHAGTVAAVARAAQALCPVIVVDDGSTAPLPELPGCILVRLERNSGKGAALRAGFKRAVELGFSHAITMDADGQHFAVDLPKFLAAAEVQPGALVVGVRDFYACGCPAGRRRSNAVSTFWFHIETGVRLGDSQCGFRGYPLALTQRLKTRSGRYAFELEFMVRAAWVGTPIVAVPVKCSYEPNQIRLSHFRPVKDLAHITIMNIGLVLQSWFVPRHVAHGVVLWRKKIAAENRWGVFCRTRG